MSFANVAGGWQILFWPECAYSRRQSPVFELPGDVFMRPGQVIARETHMSWVFMTADRVYKLKKPVRFAYLNFSTLERRAAASRAEDMLNRRLAPDIYLGVVPLTLSTVRSHESQATGLS